MSIARTCDYLLFGKHHFEADRQFVADLLAVAPELGYVAREHRAFLGRVVRLLAKERGIRQFIEYGSGLPTRQNVHEIAQTYAPDARVVYVDNDPVVLAHCRALLAKNDSTIVIAADLAQPEQVLSNPMVSRLLTFTEPIALLYVSVLHCLPDRAKPFAAVARMRQAVPPGSYLAVSQLATDDDRTAAQITTIANHATPWGRVRRPEEIHRVFDGLEVVTPGLGNVAGWRLDLGPALQPPPESSDDAEWPQAWRDDLLDRLAGRTLWEEGGVARC